MSRTDVSCAAHERCIGGGEGVLVQSHIVFQPGACMSPRSYRPFVQDNLVRADPGSAPGSVIAEQPLHGMNVIVKDIPVRWHGIPDAHDELHLGRAINLAILRHLGSLENVAEIEGLHLRLDAVGLHFGR